MTEVGRAAKVAVRLAENFSWIKHSESQMEDGFTKCTELEEKIKNTVASVVATTLASLPPDFPVSVEVSGGLLDRNGPGMFERTPPTFRAVHPLTIKIEPIPEFLEESGRTVAR
jgi:hypothetical protein